MNSTAGATPLPPKVDSLLELTLLPLERRGSQKRKVRQSLGSFRAHGTVLGPDSLLDEACDANNAFIALAPYCCQSKVPDATA